MATKTATKIKPMKKMAKGGQSKKCPKGQAYDISLGRCVNIDNDMQSLFGINLKGGVDWFGEDSPSAKTVINNAKPMVKGASNVAKKIAEAAKKKSKMGGATYKTGGMVNPNAKMQAQKAAGSKGVKPGVNPKASAANTASSKGSGKANTPPSKATPAAKYGKMMKKGGMVKAKKK